MKSIYTLLTLAFSMGAWASPIAEAEPEPAPALPTSYKNYGKYGNYGTYPTPTPSPTPTPTGYGSYKPYGNYGTYKRMPEGEAEADMDALLDIAMMIKAKRDGTFEPMPAPEE